MANRRFIDFPIATTVGNNDIVLIWQDGLNKQTTKATLFQGSPQSLAGLTDVDISALNNGQILQYNSTTSKWENVDRTDINLSELSDVTIVAPSNGQVLVYNSSTGKWENSSGGYVPYIGAVTTVNLGAQTIQAGSFVKAGGTSAQFLKANGSVDSTAYGTGTVTSVALTMPSAFSVANSPITTTGTLAVTGAGTVGQYIRGDGSLADFPATTGGGSSVSYYLNGSVSQGTIGGVAYKELNRTPVFGTGTDISINADGYIASFITDALDPNKLLIPGGNWNFETYFSASSSGGSPSFYVELYKYDGTTFTLLATSSSAPELIAFGTNLNPYFSTLAVPETVLALTDRLAVRFYVTHSGRTITLHTENGHLCQVITTFTTGLTALNGLTSQVQFFAVGTSGTDFAISSASDTHTFNLPTASATNRGALSSTDWTTFNNKENAITAGTTAQYFRGDKTFQTLNTSVVPEGTNLYYTEARVNANTNVAANTAARHNAVTLGTANGLSLSTQVLSLGLASAGVTGALSGTDWSTFNNKQNALTNPVTGTGTTNYLPKFTGTSTIGNSQVFDNGTNVLIGTTTDAGFKLDVNGTGRFGGIITTTSSGIASGNFGGIAASWEGNAGYPTLFGSHADRWIMHINPHISYTQNGVNGFTGSMTGATLRYASNPAAASYWDIGVGTNSVGADKMSLGRAGVNFLAITNAGNIGIGTATPAMSLQIGNGSLTGNQYLRLFNSASDIYLGQTGSNLFGAGNGQVLVTDSTYTSNFAIGTLNGSANLIFGTANTERARITSGGNLLVGTTTDNGEKLQVNGEITAVTRIRINKSTQTNQIFGDGNAFNISGSNNLGIRNDSGSIVFASGGATVQMLLNSSGNVGIGTTSPASRLQIEGTGTGAWLTINRTDSGTNVIDYTQSGTRLGYIGYIVNDLFINNSTASSTVFFTAGSERMRITSGGNVGIGTTSPNSRLHVAGDFRTVLTSGVGGDTLIAAISGVSNGYIINVDTSNNITHTWNTGANAAALRITPSGNVLIGTTTDVGARLHVNGAVRTGAPSGGSAVDWRLGTARGGTITPNAIVRVEIGGVLVDLDARYV